jgi:hypothetical protein
MKGFMTKLEDWTPEECARALIGWRYREVASKRIFYVAAVTTDFHLVLLYEVGNMGGWKEVLVTDLKKTAGQFKRLREETEPSYETTRVDASGELPVERSWWAMKDES